MTVNREIAPRTAWLLFVHQLPSNPAYLRVKVWRRLQRLGAVAIKNTIYALPSSEHAQEDFEWLAKEIVEAGGEAVIFEARLIGGLSDPDVRALFNAARDNDYAEIIDEARALAAKVDKGSVAEPSPDLKGQLARLKERYAQTIAVDFFDATGRLTAETSIAGIERKLAGDFSSLTAGQMPAKALDLKGRVWVTRQGVHVDRIACAWMVRRFIDQNARFKFVQTKNYVPSPGELRFDMYEAEFTHEGDRCSFEVLRERAGLGDAALEAIAEIVHDIDLKDNKFGRDQTAGVKTLIAAICSGTDNDEERIARGSVLLEDLYAAFQRKPRRHSNQAGDPERGMTSKLPRKGERSHTRG